MAELSCDGISLGEIAERFGTPCYVYSAEKLRHQCQALRSAFANTPAVFCYAVKASSNGHILKEVFAQGYGADVVSGGELIRALRSGALSHRTVFSGVGKQDWELELAIKEKILAFNVESFEELKRLAQISRSLGTRSSVILRVNPDIDAKTFPYVSTGLTQTKFGIPQTEWESVFNLARTDPHLKWSGVGCHIGSQIRDLRVFKQMAEQMAALVLRVRSEATDFRYLDLGGGLPVSYDGSEVPSVEDYARTLRTATSQLGVELILEPGRFLVAEAGLLLTRILGCKTSSQKNFLITDAAMNDLIRPSLYQAFHAIRPTRLKPGPEQTWDIVGPVCETGDFLGLERKLSFVECGDLLAIENAGAYGFSMTSNYNSRPKPCEVLVDGGKARLIRRRETIDDLIRLET